jgi:hypothetical protein
MHRLADTAAAEFVYLENRVMGRGDACALLEMRASAPSSVSERRINLTAHLAPVRHAEILQRRSGGRHGSEAGDLPVHEVHLNRPLLLKISFDAQYLASEHDLNLNLELSRRAKKLAPNSLFKITGRASELP